MKITIELTEAQVKGIKEYLQQVDDISNPGKDHVTREIRGIVDSALQSGAVYDYIQKFEK